MSELPTATGSGPAGTDSNDRHRWLTRAALMALVAYVASRLLILLAMLLAVSTDNSSTEHLPGGRVIIDASGGRLSEMLEDATTRNDAGWYHGIVENGYASRPFDSSRQENWAFFPLHPMLWRASTMVFGDGPLAALLLPNLLCLLALMALHMATRGSGRDAATADRAVFALALFPTSYFLSLPWSESLFLLCSAGAFFAATQRRWMAMGIAGALASACRFSGVFLLPALFLLLWRRRHAMPGRAWMALTMIPLGAVVFMLWLWAVSGNPLAFADIQSSWGRVFGPPVRAVGIMVLQPTHIAVEWNFRYLNLAALMIGLLAIRHFLYRREFALAVLVAAGVLLPAMTDSLTSMTRYALGTFPLMLAIADWTRSALAERLWFALSASLLAFMAGAFALGLTFAGA